VAWYIVCYTIPEEPKKDEVYESIMASILAEVRSEDYQPIYDKLDEIGRRILTSTYLVEYDGTAGELLEHVLAGLSTDIRSRIKLLISELSTNQAYFPPRRRQRNRKSSG